MDAVKMLQESRRLCKTYDACYKCPLRGLHWNVTRTDKEIKKYVAIVEKWSKEHPPMTNRQKFKEVFGIDADGTFLDTFYSAWLDKEYSE